MDPIIQRIDDILSDVDINFWYCVRDNAARWQRTDVEEVLVSGNADTLNEVFYIVKESLQAIIQ